MQRVVLIIQGTSHESVCGENPVHFLNHFRILQAEFEFNPAGSLRVLNTVDIDQISIAAAFGGEDLLELLFLRGGEGRHLQAVKGNLQRTVLAQFQVRFIGALGVRMAFNDDFTQIQDTPEL